MTPVMDAVAAATAAVPRLYELNSVPASPTYPYGVYSATLGRGETYTLDITYGVRFGRIVVQIFGKTADSALSLMESVIFALLDNRLTIAGYEATACLLELDPTVTRDPDDKGVVGVTATFTFTATKEAP